MSRPAIPDFTTPFVGRGDLLEDVGAALGDRQSVALYGPPGIGKSRVASEVARRWSGPVLWLDAGDRLTPASLVAALAELVGVSRPDVATLDGALEHLSAPLRARSDLLLVVDDLDAVPEAANVLALLSSWTTVLATARSPLQIGQSMFVELLGADAGAELYLKAAEQVLGSEPDFLEEAVRELVTALDGLPFAIELAAGRANLLGPAQMLERLDDRFELLRRSGTDGTEALESALAWAWEQLAQADRSLVARLAIVGVPVDLEVVEALADDDVENVYDALERLFVAGWLTRDDDEYGGARFRLYNTHAAFARLQADSETIGAGVTAACEHLAARARSLHDAMETAAGQEALAQFISNSELFRWAADEQLKRAAPSALSLIRAMRHPAALAGPRYLYSTLINRGIELAAELGDDESLVDLCDLAAVLRLRCGEDTEVKQFLDRANSVPSRPPSEVTARLVRTRSMLAPPDEALAMLQRSRDDTEDDSPVIRAAIEERLGQVHTHAFRLEQARASFERARRLLGDRPLFDAEIDAGLAHVSFRQGRLTEALGEFERVATRRGRWPSTPAYAGALFNLAVAFHAAGELNRAEEELLRAREIWLRLNGTSHLPSVLARLGIVQLESGRTYAARETLQDARMSARKTEDAQSLGLALAHLGLLDHTDVAASDLSCAISRSHEREPDVTAASWLGLAFILHDQQRAVAPAVEELFALLSEDDTYYQEVLGLMVQIARALDCMRAARATADAKFRNRKLDEAVDHLRQPFHLTSADGTDERIARAPSPFVRLFARRALELLAEEGVELYAPSNAPVLTVHSHCHWYRASGGDPVDIAAKQANRLILKRILQSHLDDPQSTVDIEELMAAGWPGESMTYESGRNRVYAAIRFLRDNELRDMIETTESGYRIAPNVRVKIAPVTGLRTPGDA